jgi:hypothetical protein
LLVLLRLSQNLREDFERFIKNEPPDKPKKLFD